MNHKTVTFKLSFGVDPQGAATASAAFLRQGAAIAAQHKPAFHYWHASFHRDLSAGTHNELWFQFRASEDDADRLERDFGSDLRNRASFLGFTGMSIVVQDETKAFADVIAQIGGPVSMDTLWPQVQTATEWAISDLPAKTERQTPAQWYPWARHIYRNLLELK